ncbi:MAG: ATP-binding protein [Acidimicrobiales bacterium]
MRGTWSLVGRREELALLGQAAREGTGGGSVVAGAAGVGKTRLVSAALSSLAQDGWATEWTTASDELSAVPLGAFAHLVSLDAVASSGSSLDVGGFAGAIQALRANAGGRRLCVGVDDAHLLDPASIGLLQLVARHGIGYVMATVRADESGAERLAWLWKDGGERVELQALSRTECEQLVVELVGGPVDAATMAELWARTGHHRGRRGCVRRRGGAALRARTLAKR